MEKFVFSLYGVWFWLTRKYRSAVYGEAAVALAEAREYLWNDYATRASTIDRGSLLPQHIEALAVLDRHSALAARTSSRFASLRECIRFIAEELSEVPASSTSASPATNAAPALDATRPPLTAAGIPSFLTFGSFSRLGVILTRRVRISVVRRHFVLSLHKPGPVKALALSLSSQKSRKSLQSHGIDLAA